MPLLFKTVCKSCQNPCHFHTDNKKVNISLQLLPAILPCGKKNRQLATVQTAMGSFIDVQPVSNTSFKMYLGD